MGQDRCANCGAPRPQGAGCPYCHAGGSAFSLGELATITRRDASTLDSLLPQLCNALEEALPGLVRVERGGGPFRRGTSVRRIEATIGDQQFSLTRQGARMQTVVVLRVRGIEIKHEELAMPAWLDRLAGSLAVHATQNVDVGPGLSRLIGR
jgi:hypothetical protein